jgi:formylglycine-generating enzyme required for sulfatase activity
MNRFYFLSLLVFLFSCDSKKDVEQIKVSIPAGQLVPEEMIYIPAGKFIMGDAEESTTIGGKPVMTGAYLIDKYEVNHEEYKKFLPQHSFNQKKASWPIAHVNYSEAEAYCQSKNKRLPSETEWEKAARGSDGRKWPWRIFAKHPNNGFSGFMSEPVDKRTEWISPYGVYGMGHNVWEWTTDDYVITGQLKEGQSKFKVIRGGVLQTHLTIKFSPTWFRNWMDPESKLNFIGFRCAKDV